MKNSSKGPEYRIFKQNFGMEHYLKTLSSKKIFVKFRTANHHLPGETGRWHGKFISQFKVKDYVQSAIVVRLVMNFMLFLNVNL